MTMLLQKGLDYNATYSSLDYPTLVAGWTGSVSFYAAYPGTATFTKTLTVVGNTFALVLTVGEIIALASGVYSAVATMTNTGLGVEISSLEYATVLEVNTSDATKCKIYGTIENVDGTPTGYATTTLQALNGVLTNVAGWQGIDVVASFSTADLDPADSTTIVGVNDVRTTTNTSGYFKLFVIQGFTYSLSCKNLGRTLTIDTSLLTPDGEGNYSINISTFF